ncbi:MAG: hypothetical protein SFW35_12770, partial [Chitinophagales bacterium]|nr:hypothetical protein [Chitinophagales bacterium]
ATDANGCPGREMQQLVVSAPCPQPTATITSFSNPTAGLSNGSISTLASNLGSQFSVALQYLGLGGILTNLPFNFNITLPDVPANSTVTIFDQSNTLIFTSASQPTVGNVTFSTSTLTTTSFSVVITSSVVYTNSVSCTFTDLTAGNCVVTYTQQGTGSNVQLNQTLNSTCPPYSVSVTSSPALCTTSSGSLSTYAALGRSPYQVRIQGQGQDRNGSINGSSFVANNLPPGAYTITFTDANGCIEVRQDTVKQDSTSFTSLVTVKPDTCNRSNGSIQVFASQGIGPFSAIISGTSIQPISGVINGNYVNAVGLPAGNYSVTITDANGCARLETAIVGNTSNGLAATIDVAPTYCGGSYGFAIANSTTGGNPPYSYSWSAGTPNNGACNGLPPGIHTVTITDASGCSGTQSFEIENKEDTIELNGVVIWKDTCSKSVGKIDFDLFANTSLTLTWSNGVTTNGRVGTNFLTGLTPGEYTVTVTSDCDTLVKAFTVGNISPQISATIDVAPTYCGGSNGFAIANSTTGGNPPYSYSWSAGTPNNGWSAPRNSYSYHYRCERMLRHPIVRDREQTGYHRTERRGDLEGYLLQRCR